MKLLIQVNEVSLLTLLPSNDDPYKIVARKVSLFSRVPP